MNKMVEVVENEALYRAALAALEAERLEETGPFNFQTANELLDDEWPRNPPWLVRGIVQEKALGITSGVMSYEMNRRVAFELAMAVATGTDAFGKFSTSGIPRHTFIVGIGRDRKEFEWSLHHAHNRPYTVSSKAREDAAQEASTHLHRLNGARFKQNDFKDDDEVAQVVASIWKHSKAPELIVFDFEESIDFERMKHARDFMLTMRRISRITNSAVLVISRIYGLPFSEFDVHVSEDKKHRGIFNVKPHVKSARTGEPFLVAFCDEEQSRYIEPSEVEGWVARRKKKPVLSLV